MPKTQDSLSLSLPSSLRLITKTYSHRAVAIYSLPLNVRTSDASDPLVHKEPVYP